MRIAVTTLLALALVPATAPSLSSARAQEPGLKIAVGDVGIGIGDVPRLDGLRLNFRDRRLERVRGINATVWTPHDENEGVVRGLALGLPLTGAREITGLAAGAGFGVDEDFRGVGLAPLGFGAGENLRGIAVGGLGMGVGGSVRGIAVGGLGLGIGESVRGAVVGGLGAGVGGSVTGLAVGGLGIGAGASVRGVVVAGLGAGIGGDLKGITLAGAGAGVGGELSGLTVAGVGVGAGGGIRGVTLAGIGVGAPTITGLTVVGVGAGGREVTGAVVAPAYFHIEKGRRGAPGVLRGASLSAFNHVEGIQRGLTIGLLNIAQELHGVQIGLINIAWNKDSFPVLPLLNYHP